MSAYSAAAVPVVIAAAIPLSSVRLDCFQEYQWTSTLTKRPCRNLSKSPVSLSYSLTAGSLDWQSLVALPVPTRPDEGFCTKDGENALRLENVFNVCPEWITNSSQSWQKCVWPASADDNQGLGKSERRWMRQLAPRSFCGRWRDASPLRFRGLDEAKYPKINRALTDTQFLFFP